MKLTFEESARGCSKPIDVSVPDTCPRCRGHQAEPGTKKTRCHHCNGTGMVSSRQTNFNISFSFKLHTAVMAVVSVL